MEKEKQQSPSWPPKKSTPGSGKRHSHHKGKPIQTPEQKRQAARIRMAENRRKKRNNVLQLSPFKPSDKPKRTKHKSAESSSSDDDKVGPSGDILPTYSAAFAKALSEMPVHLSSSEDEGETEVQPQQDTVDNPQNDQYDELGFLLVDNVEFENFFLCKISFQP